MLLENSMLTKILLRAGIVVLVLIVAYVLRLIYLVQTTSPADGFGSAGAITACPTNRPNCVSTLNTETGFKANPFEFSAGSNNAMLKLKAAIATQARAEIVFESATRLDVTFKTALFGFRDDASFELNLSPATNQSAGRIEFRSRSRVGYSDLGVNAKRIEHIRLAFLARP
jgi:uncharacterized protein (DUF1499 family)